MGIGRVGTFKFKNSIDERIWQFRHRVNLPTSYLHWQWWFLGTIDPNNV